MPSNLQKCYKKLLERSKQLIVLGSTEALVSWDMETMMPAKAVELRSEQLALLSEVHHKMATNPEIGKLLDTVLKHPNYESLNGVQKRNVYLIKKNYDEQTKLPTKLVTALAKQQTISVNIWKKAKAQKNYGLFKPELEKLVSLNKQAAEILMKVKETKTPYDALLDIYESKITAKIITPIFKDLQAKLENLLSKIEGAKQPDLNTLSKTVPVDKQREIAKMLMAVLGYEIPPSPNAAGRLDETEHPFTGGYYDDVRITTHYHPGNFASSIFSVLHETGHALYEQGLPQQWKYEPVGSACSMGIHESQSRLYENIIGRSNEFWTTTFPRMKALVNSQLAGGSLDNFIHAINTVRPSKIRIESDEVTYSLHIIIRFQMESDLFSGKISVDELPAVWNQKYKDILGLRINNDSEGVMQDTHWASGLYGYFPTYALGNVYSGQITETINNERPEWQGHLTKGELSDVRNWLADHVYMAGNLYDPADLIKKITGSALTVEPYIKYLHAKYRKLYEF
jgi:carboxypeptidase Taq